MHHFAFICNITSLCAHYIEIRLILLCIMNATEYGAGNMVSTHGDIYSYGILVLETITGRRPTDSAFRQGLSLREHVDLALQDRIVDAVDTRLSLDLLNELRTVGESAYKRKTELCCFTS